MIKKALIIPDCHRPYHSHRAYNVMLEAALSTQIDEIVILGDYVDFYPVSRYAKHPGVIKNLQDEIKSANEGLDELDELFPHAKKVYLEGNHEKRLETFLVEKAPELFGMTEVSRLFGIESRPNWSFHPFGRHQKYRVLGTDLFARHRPLKTNPAQGLRQAMVSYCYGDIHKIEEAWAVRMDLKKLVCFSPGWLGEERNQVFDYMQTPEQWQHGFAIVSADSTSAPSKSWWTHEIIKIDKGQCVFNGKLFK